MLNWQMWSGELAPDLCDSLIQNFGKLPAQDGKTFNGNDSHRTSIIRWVHGEFGLKDHLEGYYHRANNEAFGVDVGNKYAMEMQFTEYHGSDAGEYKWHHDVDWTSSKPNHRKLSMVIQLSDPESYVGGDFMFNEVEIPKKDDLRKRGTVLVFPSYLQHCVTPVTEGTRYSLVSWLSGPRWR